MALADRIAGPANRSNTSYEDLTAGIQPARQVPAATPRPRKSTSSVRQITFMQRPRMIENHECTAPGCENHFGVLWQPSEVLHLLIALALAAYNLFAGGVALRLIATGQPAAISPERLADTARRAGIAVFVAITAAAFALVYVGRSQTTSRSRTSWSTPTARFPATYKFAALWSGQEGSLLLWCWLLATYGFVLRLRHKTDVKLYAYAGTILAGDPGLLSRNRQLRRAAVRAASRRDARRRQRPQSPAPVSGDGDPSADALPRLRGILRAVCLCDWAR